MRLDHLVLRIKDPGISLPFYRERLGMRLECQAEGTDGYGYVLAFPGADAGAARLILNYRPGTESDPAAVYAPSKADGYWKIGVTLPDVDAGRHRLLEAGIAVSAPQQFRDIGYLCHLADPDGFTIELLQHVFADNFRPSPVDEAVPLGGRPTLGQITIRVRDPEASLGFYRDLLGMRLLSRQTVEPYGFTLYFLAHTDEAPPNPDLDAVGNREWLWRRPYTTLELQHVWGTERTDMTYRTHDNDPLGFGGLGFAVDDLTAALGMLQAADAPVTAKPAPDPIGNRPSATARDPDGNVVRLLEPA